MREYGTVISQFDSPSTQKFSFVINKDVVVRRGQFVQLAGDDGTMIGRVADIRKANRYYMRPESVNQVEQTASLADTYPTWEWEFMVADVIPIGIITPTGMTDANIPPSPGSRVFEPESTILEQFFGFEPTGLHLGQLAHHAVPVRLNLTKLLHKHLAILAMSGAGKSHLMAIIIEELLKRTPDQGQIGMVVIDPHGEYVAFADDPAYANTVRVIPINDVQISLKNLREANFHMFIPDLTSAQSRVLAEALTTLRGKNDAFTLGELINDIEAKEITLAVKNPLLAELMKLARLRLFGSHTYPHPTELAKQGMVTVIDLSSENSLKKKRLVTAYLAEKLFQFRCNGAIPPFVLVVEEAHQFVPEKAPTAQTASRTVLEKIAREGRKFHAALCLISQRPVKLSTTILSQCNTHVILRITNPYDLKNIEESSEGIDRDVARQISSLNVGSGLLVGEAVSYPLFLKIRGRTSNVTKGGVSLEQASRNFAQEQRQKKADARAML
ncbi:MAG: ATP-binding protein [Nanoarchaeota archaeon]|nr:ATP-binding protein [Nanoarchaeota archaeon]